VELPKSEKFEDIMKSLRICQVVYIDYTNVTYIKMERRTYGVGKQKWQKTRIKDCPRSYDASAAARV